MARARPGGYAPAVEDPREAVRRAARLARLDLSEVELREAAPELEAILEAFGALTQVPVDGVEPLVAPHPPAEGQRADEPAPSLPAGRLLDAAPEVRDGRYRTPRAVE